MLIDALENIEKKTMWFLSMGEFYKEWDQIGPITRVFFSDCVETTSCFEISKSSKHVGDRRLLEHNP